MPPFWHGLDRHGLGGLSFLSIQFKSDVIVISQWFIYLHSSQHDPLYHWRHSHIKPLPWGLHKPLFLHGLLEQGSYWISKFKHKHRYKNFYFDWLSDYVSTTILAICSGKALFARTCIWKAILIANTSVETRWTVTRIREMNLNKKLIK